MIEFFNKIRFFITLMRWLIRAVMITSAVCILVALVLILLDKSNGSAYPEAGTIYILGTMLGAYTCIYSIPLLIFLAVFHKLKGENPLQALKVEIICIALAIVCWIVFTALMYDKFGVILD
jgi:hypothetical protein